MSWARLEDPTQDQFVKQAVAGAKRILAHKTNKKEPITLEMLVDRFAEESTDLDDIRIVAVCLIGFAGFLKFNELSALKESDLQIYTASIWKSS
jgi:hypothetical protein